MNLAACTTVIRARRSAAVAAVFACVELHLRRQRKRKRIHRPIFSFPVFIRGVRPIFFARLYRMSKEAFEQLADELLMNQDKVLRSCGLLRLSITLRWLAGGSYLDLAMTHQQSISSVYHYIDTTLSSIDRAFNMKFPYDDPNWLAKSSMGFSRNGKSPLSGCCAALDGIAIKIEEPSATDVKNPSTYYNRKGFFALNIQALCDSTYRFLYMSALTPGSTHDSTALAMSELASLLARTDGGLLDNYWIAADDAYVCTERIVCPWPGRNLSTEKDCFNYWQSSARIHIEQSFGILMARWGIFRRPLRLRVGKAAKVVAVCCKLHNYIMDNSRSGADSEFNQGRDAQETCNTTVEDHVSETQVESCDIRNQFTDSIRAEGLHRPRIY